jgi:hypothetical protein
MNIQDWLGSWPEVQRQIHDLNTAIQTEAPATSTRAAHASALAIMTPVINHLLRDMQRSLDALTE